MAQATAIEWADVSWNPVHGCSKVSPGCAHCYAETLSRRHGQTPKPWTPANAAENVLLKPHKLREPLGKAKPWDQPCRVFVNSMSDLFHELIPDGYIDQVFAVMAWAEQHTFQVLTKRPERMRDYLADPERERRIEDAMCALCCGQRPRGRGPGYGICGFPGEDCGLIGAGDGWPLPNVWLGTSIENRRFVGRADVLRETPAAVRFISAEPLLGPLVFETCDQDWSRYPEIRARYGWRDGSEPRRALSLEGIDWLIVGGESGPGRRPMREEWVRDLRDVCLAQGLGHLRPDPGGRTAFFFKQWGGARPGGEALLDGREWREFPEVARG